MFMHTAKSLCQLLRMPVGDKEALTEPRTVPAGAPMAGLGEKGGLTSCRGSSANL